MATDEELLIHDILNSQWNESNCTKPKFYYTDEIKLHDFNLNTAIKIYTLNVIETPKSLGYTSYRNEIFVTIDVRTKSRSQMLAVRDEVKRIIRANRKSLTGFQIFKKVSERKIASYINYHQYVIEVSALNYIINI